ncbi:hypothetical protein JCM10908_005772 [Rhodotorula pacifica]|uniref:uncharacterized protein n=1 Tax=Rhodotorula pacifica TaxID=1495444 RepID=UPI00317649F3
MEPTAPTEAPYATCLTSLPTELLQQILSGLLDSPYLDIFPEKAKEAMTSLLSAMRSCRALLVAGRPLLYAMPTIDIGLSALPDEETTRRAIDRFLRTMKRNKSLAAMVEDSSAVVERVIRVFDKAGDRKSSKHNPSQASGLYAKTSEKYGAQEDVLRACPYVRTAAVQLANRHQARRVGVLLADPPRLRNLKLEIRPEPLYEPMDGDSSCILMPSTESDCQIELARICLAELSLRQPGQPPIASLSIEFGFSFPHEYTVCTCTLRDVLAGLQHLDLNFFFASVDTLTGALVGNHLETFVLSSSAYDQAKPAFECFRILISPVSTEYDQHGGFSVYPLELYELFPHARKLAFGREGGMTLGKLDLLATTSSELEMLDLHNAFWSALKPSELFVGPDSIDGLSSFERRVVAILSRLKHLTHVALGIWPFVVPDKGPEAANGRTGLQAWAVANGIKVIVSGCYAW